MKILIGYDGSADSMAAVRDLANAGLPEKAQALIATVTTPWQPQVPGFQFSNRLGREASGIVEEALKTAEALAEEAALRLGRIFPGWRIRTEAVIGPPAEELLKKAEAWRPDLIVLGCHGRTALGRLLMGSVSQKVLHHAATDVRIHRSRKGGSTPAPRILVAVDGSVGADCAVSAVAVRTWPKGTKVRIVVALDGDRLVEALNGIKAVAGAGRDGDARRRWVERKSESAASRLASARVSVVPVVKVGDARIAILREAREWGADCIFLGSRGLGGLERFLLGSVSTSVAMHAPCTVEIVRKKRLSGKRAPGVPAFPSGLSSLRVR